jgi:hypothetical protein
MQVPDAGDRQDVLKAYSYAILRGENISPKRYI